MTQEDKELLLKDLCARLPYSIKVQYTYRVKDMVWKVLGIEYCRDIRLLCGALTEITTIDKVKPYLRPMSSMTEEEKEEYELLANHCIVTSVGFVYIESQTLIDWLNAHYFDYRGLIEKGLALEASEGMYDV